MTGISTTDFFKSFVEELQPSDVQQLKYILKDSFTGRFYWIFSLVAYQISESSRTYKHEADFLVASLKMWDNQCIILREPLDGFIKLALESDIVVYLMIWYIISQQYLEKPRFRNWYLCKSLLERFTFVSCEKLDNLWEICLLLLKGM